VDPIQFLVAVQQPVAAEAEEELLLLLNAEPMADQVAEVRVMIEPAVLKDVVRRVKEMMAVLELVQVQPLLMLIQTEVAVEVALELLELLVVKTQVDVQELEKLLPHFFQLHMVALMELSLELWVAEAVPEHGDLPQLLLVVVMAEAVEQE
tara:strand:+ start:288 stop:740 length:453 start_codon:yes stop_codon:yes gene_type:complete